MKKNVYNVVGGSKEEDDLPRACYKCADGVLERFKTSGRFDLYAWKCTTCGYELKGDLVTHPHDEIIQLPEEKINHPNHYGGDTPYEVIKVTEEWERIFFLDSGIVTAITYMARAKMKGTQLDDLKKARWYLDRKIKQLEGSIERS